MRLHVDPGAIEAEQTGTGERVPNVVQPGPAPLRASLESSIAGDEREGVLDSHIDESFAHGGYEEARCLGSGTQPVAHHRVGLESLDRTRMQWQLSALVELGVPDNEYAVVEIDVVAIEGDEFSNPSASHLE